jgi:hypothetical protein
VLIDSGIAYPVLIQQARLFSISLNVKVEAGEIIIISFAFAMSSSTHHPYCLSLDGIEGA